MVVENTEVTGTNFSYELNTTLQIGNLEDAISASISVPFVVGSLFNSEYLELKVTPTQTDPKFLIF